MTGEVTGDRCCNVMSVFAITNRSNDRRQAHIATNGGTAAPESNTQNATHRLAKDLTHPQLSGGPERRSRLCWLRCDKKFWFVCGLLRCRLRRRLCCRFWCCGWLFGGCWRRSCFVGDVWPIRNDGSGNDSGSGAISKRPPAQRVCVLLFWLPLLWVALSWLGFCFFCG